MENKQVAPTYQLLNDDVPSVVPSMQGRQLDFEAIHYEASVLNEASQHLKVWWEARRDYVRHYGHNINVTNSVLDQWADDDLATYVKKEAALESHARALIAKHRAEKEGDVGCAYLDKPSKETSDAG